MSVAGDAVLVIVGAGQAGGELAVATRQGGFTGRIVLVGEEIHLPYQRPPLSKAYLTGALVREGLFPKHAAAYAKAEVELELGRRVIRIDRHARQVVLSDGGKLSYTKLALACGGRPRRLNLPGLLGAQQPANLHYLRTIDDVDRIRAQFHGGLRLAIIGGGYIGLEVAAVANKLGLHVTVLEAMPRVLARVTAPIVSNFYEAVHRKAGVDIRVDTAVRELELDASGDAVRAVVCADGSRIDADVVIVGIGLIPNTGLSEDAALAVDNGVVVDEYCRTSDPDIFAIGDCANHPSAIFGRRLRLESVPNALEQARTVASVLAGKPKPYSSVPWFWSDQYDLKLQMTGLSEGYDEAALRGSIENRSFAVFYLREGRVIAADLVNRANEFMLAKRLVAERMQQTPAVLMDESRPLKDIIESTANSPA